MNSDSARRIRGAAHGAGGGAVSLPGAGTQFTCFTGTKSAHTDASAEQRMEQEVELSRCQEQVLSLLALLVQKVRILAHQRRSCVTVGTLFTCFTGTKVRILTHQRRSCATIASMRYG